MVNALPNKLPSYLMRLQQQYSRSGKIVERDLIAACRMRTIEDVTYDNWQGGQSGHDVKLFVPFEQLARIDLDQQAVIAEQIRKDLNKQAAAFAHEHFNAVHIEPDDERDPDFRAAVPFSARPALDPESLPIWKAGLVRLFISHRDQHKAAAKELARELEAFGITSFVAHDTIEPMAEWRKEIVKGLETMEVMLVFLTDDFEDSIWTNQEIGFALGKAIPVISLKLNQKDPPGFISHEQALRGSANNLPQAAEQLFPLIGRALGKQERLNQALVEAFVASEDFVEAIKRFQRMAAVVTELAEPQLETIIHGFYRNDQLYKSGVIVSRICSYLEKITGFEFEVDKRSLRPKKNARAVARRAFDSDDEIPF